jgi:hypothetical protein
VVVYERETLFGQINMRGNFSLLACLGFIPKGVLEKNRKISFRFPWSGNKESEDIPMVIWHTIAKPKYLGN